MGGQLDLAVFDKTVSNPQARIGDAISRFAVLAPEVRLNVHVASTNAIERGVLDGAFQIGIIPAHRSSRTLAYADLFGETMLLYCGARHPLFGVVHSGLTWEKLRAYDFAGLGFHSPNMALSHRAGLERKATGFDQEAIAMLVLSGSTSASCPTTMPRLSSAMAACRPSRRSVSATSAVSSACCAARPNRRGRRNCSRNAWPGLMATLAPILPPRDSDRGAGRPRSRR